MLTHKNQNNLLQKVTFQHIKQHKLSKRCQKAVKSCQKLSTKLSKSCPEAVPKLSSCQDMSKKAVLKLSTKLSTKSCPKAVTKLSEQLLKRCPKAVKTCPVHNTSKY